MKNKQKSTTTIKRYSDSILITSFEDRFDYLKLDSIVGTITFGGHRYINQRLYQSPEWRKIRRDVIVRDNGCDLAHPDHPILIGKILIHHIEPITIDDILARRSKVLDEDNLICVSYETHNALHYGNADTLPRMFAERKKNDTCPWR